MGDITRGLASVTSIKRGQADVSSVYRGQSLIWSATPPTPPLPSIYTTNLQQWIDPFYSAGYNTDLSGNGRNATLEGGLTVDGSGFYDLTGPSKRIDLNYIPNVSSNPSVTLCVWFNAASNCVQTRDSVGIIGNFNSSATSNWIYMQVEGNYGGSGTVGELYAHVRSNNSSTAFSCGFINDAAWRYHCMVINGSAGTLTHYINGSSAGSASLPASRNFSSGNNLYAFAFESSRFFYNSKGGSIQIYDAALGSTEINQNYNALKADYGL